MITASASSSVIPNVRSLISCSSLIRPIAASWMIWCIDMVGIDLRNRADGCLVHNDGVTLDMCMTGIVADGPSDGRSDWMCLWQQNEK